jgi:hypothetical protein
MESGDGRGFQHIAQAEPPPETPQGRLNEAIDEPEFTANLGLDSYEAALQVLSVEELAEIGDQASIMKGA